MIRIFLLWLALCSSALAQVPMTGAGLAKPASGGALSCSYTPVTTGTQGTVYTGATPSASGGTPAYTFSQTGTLPGGLSISSSTGIISGTPTANGSFPTIQVKVTDSTSTVTNCGSTFTLVIAPSGGTYTFVQVGSNDFVTSSSTFSVTLGAATVAGDSVIIAGMFDPAATATPTFSNGTNAITSIAQAITLDAIEGINYYCYYLPTVVTGSNTVTATWTGTAPSFGDMFVWTVRGKTAAFDQKAFATGTSAAPSSGNTPTLSSTSNFAIGYSVVANGITGGGAPWTFDGDLPNTGSGGEHQITTTTSPVSTVFTTGFSQNWNSLAVSFK